MHYLGNKQRDWLQNVVFADDYKVRDWFLSLSLDVEERYRLSDIILDDYYNSDDKTLLNWLRIEYIKKFGYRRYQ